MSYYLCGSCTKKHHPFGQGGARRLADQYQLPVLGEIPLDPEIPSAIGKGEPVVLRGGPSAEAYVETAGRVVAELSRISGAWAVPGPNAMEV